MKVYNALERRSKISKLYIDRSNERIITKQQYHTQDATNTNISTVITHTHTHTHTHTNIRAQTISHI